MVDFIACCGNCKHFSPSKEIIFKGFVPKNTKIEGICRRSGYGDKTTYADSTSCDSIFGKRQNIITTHNNGA